jgi:phosphoglycolate phosphatase
MISIVLFDLDGTLADTAPDLSYSLNTVLIEEGHKTLDYNELRPLVSHGAKVMVQHAFKITGEHKDCERLWKRVVEIYSQNLVRETKLFAGMSIVLDYLKTKKIPWGIVTNKPSYLTDPLVKKLNLTNKPVCVVSGDTLAKNKPNPEPILYACKLANCLPTECIYIGDAKRDIEAGQNAGTKTAIALFGYLTNDDMPEKWNADFLLNKPEDLLDIL